jgi:hypothetical protein
MIFFYLLVIFLLNNHKQNTELELCSLRTRHAYIWSLRPDGHFILLFLFVLFHLFSKIFLETESHYVSQASLKLSILLPLPPKCWNFRYEPLGPAHWSF